MNRNKCITVKVKFKPINTEPNKASEIRSIKIDFDEYKTRSVYYKVASNRVVDNEIISKYGIDYWEPYDITIVDQNLPDEHRNKSIDIL